MTAPASRPVGGIWPAKTGLLAGKESMVSVASMRNFMRGGVFCPKSLTKGLSGQDNTSTLMAAARTNSRKVLKGMAQIVAQTVELNDAFRFDALTLLNRAKARFNALEQDAPGDSAAAAQAALEPMHLAVKALLAARGYKGLSVSSSLELLRGIYGKELPEKILQGYLDVQAMKIQGAGARQALSALLSTASRLLTE
jgi:HEPN domain-containing protein